MLKRSGTRTTNLVLDREQYEEENKADVKVGLFAKMVDVLFDFNTPEEQIGRQQEMIYEVRAGQLRSLQMLEQIMFSG